MKHGQIVVCINDTYTEEQIKAIPNRPVKEERYTVDQVYLTRNGKGITLAEIDNPPLPHPSGLGTFQASFSVSRFRVVDEVPDVVIEKEVVIET